MKSKQERDELTTEQLEQVVGGLKAIRVDWDRDTGRATPIGKPVPRRRKRRVRSFDGEPVDGGTAEVDLDA